MESKQFLDEFNIADIYIGSEAGRNYYNWVEEYTKT